MSYPCILQHGGANGVTGSCHRLQMAEDRALLVDCGLFHGEPSVQKVFKTLIEEWADDINHNIQVSLAIPGD